MVYIRRLDASVAVESDCGRSYEANLVVKIVRPSHRGCNYSAKITSLIDVETGQPANIESKIFEESFGFTTCEAIQSVVDRLD